MLVVSQNKKTVANLRNILYFQVESDSICMYFEETEYEWAGEYEDSKRAKDVLQELWSAYANGEKVFIMPEK